MTSLASNIKTLIEIQGLDTAIQSIEVMLAEGIETIEDLNDCITDEISYSVEDAL